MQQQILLNDCARLLVLGILDAGVITIALDGKILSWNHGAQALSGYSADEVINQSHSCLYTKKDRISGKPECDLADALSRGRLESLGKRVGKNGQEFLAHVATSTLVGSDGLAFAFGQIIHDVTLQNERDKQLVEQLNIINLTHEGIVIWSPGGVIEFWNKGAEAMYGFSADQAIGQSLTVLLKTVFPKPIEEIREEVISHGRWDGELTHRSRDGESMTVLSRWVARFAETGELSSFVQIDRGINERKRAERKTLQEKVQRELRVQERIVEIERSDSDRELKVQERIVEIESSNSERELRVQERIVEIEKSDEERELRVQERIVELAESEGLLRSKVLELERSNEELQQFAYVCSHDLQEPLRVISNYTQLLSKRYHGQLDDKADMFIGFAVDAAKRMQDLINDLLSYSRLQTKAKNVSDVDCNQIVGMALANLEILLAETSAIVNYESLPVIKSDRTQLLLLFQNLINNSLKFRSTRSVVIDITARNENGEWLFAVRDNGIGFDMQFEERIFLIFQRLHRKEEYAGSGIGLAVCKKIVLRHGGRMWVESALGEGSTFYFTFPVTASEKLNG